MNKIRTNNVDLDYFNEVVLSGMTASELDGVASEFLKKHEGTDPVFLKLQKRLRLYNNRRVCCHGTR